MDFRSVGPVPCASILQIVCASPNPPRMCTLLCRTFFTLLAFSCGILRHFGTFIVLPLSSCLRCPICYTRSRCSRACARSFCPRVTYKRCRSSTRPNTYLGREDRRRSRSSVLDYARACSLLLRPLQDIPSTHRLTPQRHTAAPPQRLPPIAR